MYYNNMAFPSSAKRANRDIGLNTTRNFPRKYYDGRTIIDSPEIIEFFSEPNIEYVKKKVQCKLLPDVGYHEVPTDLVMYYMHRNLDNRFLQNVKTMNEQVIKLVYEDLYAKFGTIRREGQLNRRIDFRERGTYNHPKVFLTRRPVVPELRVLY
jgi:hypothetical protein